MMDHRTLEVPSWLNVSRETEDRLFEFVTLVSRWNKSINLVSKAEAGDLWQRHVLDSAQLYALAHPDASNWTDLGSGGGFPALVIAILALEKSPTLKLTLIESDKRKSVFLSEAIRQLSLNAQVCAQRIDEAEPTGADVISARALAPLPLLLGLSSRHAVQGTRFLFPKGARAQQELLEARDTWRFECTEHMSRTDSSAVILEITGLEHA